MLSLLISMEKIVQLGMLHVRYIHFALLDQWSPFQGEPREQLTISLQVKEALLWLTIKNNVMAGVLVTPGECLPHQCVGVVGGLEGWNQTIQLFWHTSAGKEVPDPGLMEVTQDLFNWLEEHQIILRCKHIPGHLHILADSLSRDGQILATE